MEIKVLAHLHIWQLLYKQQNLSGDKLKDKLSKWPMPESCDKIFVPKCNEEI